MGILWLGVKKCPPLQLFPVGVAVSNSMEEPGRWVVPEDVVLVPLPEVLVGAEECGGTACPADGALTVAPVDFFG